MVTAIFKFMDFTTKRKIPYPVAEYLIPVYERLKINFNEDFAETMDATTTKVMVFRYNRQISKRTFEYVFDSLN